MVFALLNVVMLIGQAKPTAMPHPVARTDTYRTLDQTLGARSDLKQFRVFIAKAKLGKVLAGPGPYTIFAPSDKAFARLPKSTFAALARPEIASYQIPRHIVRGKVEPKAWKATRAARTLSGDMLLFTEKSGKLFVHGSAASPKVIRASNGLIYLVDDVLLKPMRPIATGFAGGGGTGRRRSNTVIPK